ncbi:MAG: bifunctional DNA-formamidopyrimidine glycosylase/DNA-(apurinic or apyrimidinic site) lyase [Actinobacteria bacterium]|nr:bifunctional DNA-formamidopyrimidine glycosylase/DNA-(apurinic or apyrimidinic site) lyase [Actinomycetota bacterium]
MPELPEVETIVRGLNRHKSRPARPVSRVIVRGGKIFKSPGITKLVGKKLDKISRRGKNILIWFETGQCLAIHLGMTGQLCWTNSEQKPDRHRHLRLEFKRTKQALQFRDVRKFGQVKLYRSKREVWSDERIKKLGPDALQVSLADFRALLRHRRMIKALLLDQTVIAGFGNIYTDESLFAAKIHPSEKANEINPAKVKKLYASMRRIFEEAIAAGGSSVRDYRQSDGREGSFQTKHKVYRRTGLKCQRCGTKIKRLIVAGRSSHICPACQRLDN